MLKRFRNSYYSKIMVVCITAVCALTGILLPICGTLIHRQELAEELKNYDLALNQVSASLVSHQESLAANLTPIFEDDDKYNSLCNLYRSHSKKVPAEYADDVLELLSSVCYTDSYCCGVLLLTLTGHLYQYDASYHTLIPIQLRSLSQRLTPYRAQIFTDKQLETLSNDLQKPASRIYGLAATVFDSDDEETNYLGTMIFLYSGQEYSNIISNAGLYGDGTFSVLDKNRNVIYSSNDIYNSSDEFLSEDSSSASGTDDIVTKTLNGTDYYVSSLYNSRFGFTASYQIPVSESVPSNVITILAVLSLLICLAAILFYVIAFHISDQKIQSIQKAMGLIGMNNLDYRLPVPRENDEFTQIIISFNRMCEALQRNVEKAYLYEIAQRKAELYAMQTSINPHFLYNALEQIRVQILQGSYSDSSQMLLLLSKMYRNQTRRNLYISIAEECSQSENLINFYMYRYGDFEYEFDIDNSTKKYGIPKNTLQPLIENYFFHGFIPDFDDNFLSIRTRPLKKETGMWIEFCVEDNGSSITPDELKLLKEKLAAPVLSRNEDNGFALSNVNHRLKLVFGEEAQLHPDVGSDGTGFAVRFCIPAILPDILQKRQN